MNPFSDTTSISSGAIPNFNDTSMKEQLLKAEKFAKHGSEFKQIHKELKKYGDRVLFGNRFPFVSAMMLVASNLLLPLSAELGSLYLLRPIIGDIAALVALAAPCVVLLAPSTLYFKRGIFRRYYHDVLLLHVPDEANTFTFKRGSPYCKCKWCKREDAQYCQENLFDI